VLFRSLKVIISIYFPENIETPLFTCSSSGTLKISDISFMKEEDCSLLGTSLILIKSGGIFNLFLTFFIIYLGSGYFEKVSFNLFLSSTNGSIINGIIINEKQVVIKGCSFSTISSNKNGGAIYIELLSGGSFKVSNSDDLTETIFSSCTANNGKGGGIYIKLGSVITGFLLEGDLSFSKCEALIGNNIYIESDDLKKSITLNSFKYDYSSSLLPSSNDLYGNISKNSDINLREYLCPLHIPNNSLFIFFFFYIKKNYF
jgi:hypothetical protein